MISSLGTAHIRDGGRGMQDLLQPHNVFGVCSFRGTPEQLCSPQEPCSCNSKYRLCVLRGSTLPASKHIKMQTSMPLHMLFPETQPSRWHSVPLGVVVCTPLHETLLKLNASRVYIYTYIYIYILAYSSLLFPEKGFTKLVHLMKTVAVLNIVHLVQKTSSA